MLGVGPRGAYSAEISTMRECVSYTMMTQLRWAVVSALWEFSNSRRYSWMVHLLHWIWRSAVLSASWCSIGNVQRMNYFERAAQKTDIALGSTALLPVLQVPRGRRRASPQCITLRHFDDSQKTMPRADIAGEFPRISGIQMQHALVVRFSLSNLFVSN